MAISDLQAKQGNVTLTVEVVSKEEPRKFEKFGKPGRVCNAKVKDDSGEIKLTLWNDQIDKVNEGDKVKIINGYVNEWQGEKQLTTGKLGKLEIIEKSDKNQEPVYTNAPEQLERMAQGVSDDELPEKPVDDEEDIDEL